MQNNVNCKRGIFCHGLPTAKKKGRKSSNLEN